MMMRYRLLLPIVVLTASAGVGGWLLLRSTPLDRALDAIAERDYSFDKDSDADPGLSPTDATSMAGFGREPALGPVAGHVTRDSRATRANDLKDQPVYLFVVNDLQDPGPIMPAESSGPEPHVVFVYAQGGAESTIAIPLED